MRSKISANMEDYLEAIALIKKEKSVARVKDISKLMNVKTSSVTAALNTLSKNDLVIHEKYGYVELTNKGEKIARNIQKRHDMFIRFLNEILDVKRETAEEDACRIEHVISSETFEKLKGFLDFIDTNCDGDTLEWLKAKGK